MKTYTLLFLFFTLGFLPLQGQGIFDATIHTAVPYGDVNSPPGEMAQQIIDQDPQTKFLDFNELDGMGFDVDLLGVAEAATSMAFVTANDAPERDPTVYEILGSNDGINYTSLATGVIPCVADRFLSRVIPFSNVIAFSYYRVNFVGTCNPSSIIQLADVQLFTTIGNAPTINCPQDITVSTTPGQCDGIATFNVTANDVEDGMLTPTQVAGLASGSTFPIGSTPIVLSATDSDGNTISCDFSVTVEDMENPSFVCPDDITLSVTNTGQTEVVWEYDVIDSDNCSNINPKVGYTSLGTIAGKSYYLSDSFLIVNDAIIDAFTSGEGLLGTIRSEADNEYLLAAINRSGYIGAFLIGYNDANSEGDFVWYNADTSTYANWNEGEPNNSGVGGVPENYTVVQTSGFWNDVAATETDFYRYLLEVDYELPQTQGLPSGSAFPLGVTTNTFVATDLFGNTNTCEFTITVTELLSVEDQELEKGLSMSPNPTQDLLTLSNTSDIPLEHVAIYDIHGKMLHTINLKASEKQHTIDVANLVPGLYLLKIKGEKGIITKKMIKL